MTKFLFTADIHANKTRIDKVNQLFEKCKEIIKEKKIDYFVIGGDLWNSSTVVSKASGFSSVIEQMNEILKLCKVIMIYGTSSHEFEGSLSVFGALGATVVEKNTLLDLDGIKTLCIPEPRRSNYIRPTAKEITEAMKEDLDRAFDNEADLVFFHGEISGATYQNGMKSNSEVQVTAEMFRRCGAKLLLAGHIHSPQEIGKNMYYVGSPIPVTFSEQHSPSVISFSFDNGEIKEFKRIELGFPRNKLMDIDDLSMYRKLDRFNFKNECIKIRLKLTPEEKVAFSQREEARKLKEATGASEVTINVSVKKEVSVRSKEISSARTAVDKLKIYAKVNGIKLTDDTIGKARAIEDNLAIEYQFPSHSLELMSVDIRGAKGIKNHDDLFIDFTKYDDGVVAFVGSNGCGKTHTIELCSPFPKMLTRSGSLRNYFYLKDSHRIVTYRDENGRYYRFSTYLAANTDSGLVEYFAEYSDDKGNTWIKFPGINGKLDPYKKTVSEIFGDISVYLRTAFFTKSKVKGINDIATAGKTERLELFSQLLGIDNLSTMHDMVKKELKELSDKMKSLENIEKECNEVQSEISRKKSIENIYASELKEIESTLERIEGSIKEAKEKHDEFSRNYGKYDNMIQLKNRVENDIAESTEHLEKLKVHKIKNDYFMNHTEQISEFKEVWIQLKPLEEEFTRISGRYKELSDRFIEASDEFNSLKSRLDAEQSKLDNADNRIEAAEKNIINIEDFCPTCGAKLSASKKKQLMKAQEFQHAELESLIRFKETQKGIVKDVKSCCRNAEKTFNDAKKKKSEYRLQYDEIEQKLRATRTYIDMNDLSDYIDYIPVNNLESDIERFSKEIERNLNLLKNFEGLDLVDYKKRLEDLESERKKNEDFRVGVSMNLASARTEIKQLEERYDTIKEQAETMKRLSKDFEEYSVLEQAFANTGIQALELEAAAPEIQALTNQILLDGYGDKFSVSIETLKDSGKKVIDDCEIMVTNQETGWTIPLDELSEGEKTWIIQSLQYSFSIIRAHSTGFSFMVRFADEADGALDEESRPKYVSMIKSAHRNGDSRLTILITHSRDVKNMVNQVIQL